jgi:heme-degrading monooxygenase HmoA
MEVVRVILMMRVKDGEGEAFENAWYEIADEAAHVVGNRRQTLLRDRDDPATYVITTEWDDRAAFHEFEVSPEQHELIAPLRELREAARQIVYEVVADRPTPKTAASEDGRRKGRVVFLVKLKPGAREQFLEAYESIRYEVARGVDGHIVDQVCESPDDPDSWLITSEWRSIDDFLAWEATEAHRVLAKPLRDCIAEARSLKFEVREETSRGSSANGEADGEVG